MKHILVALLVIGILPSCAAAEPDDKCADLTDLAIGSALGDSTDTYNLAVRFYTGECVKQSYENAAVLWERAAAADVVSAKNNLGYLLSEGLGVKKDAARAAKLWLEAAKAGHSESQVHLGNALFYGWGVPKDQVRGLAWVLRAKNSAAESDELGGGPEIVKMAEEEKAKMLAASPSLLTAAIALEPTLEAASNER